jgi:hypothetical protein
MFILLFSRLAARVRAVWMKVTACYFHPQYLFFVFLYFIVNKILSIFVLECLIYTKLKLKRVGIV